MGEATTGYDVLVVGAGSAGIPCALAAAERGARVLVVDKADRIGGTLHVSGGHVTGAGTRRQRERDIVDHPDDHYADVMRIGRGRARPDLLRLAVDLAAPTIDWLDELGLEHDERSPRIVYGHEPYGAPRTHYGPDEARSILAVLAPPFERAVARGAIDLWLDAPVTALRTGADGAVTGAVVRRGDHEVTVPARATVLATGGYGADPDRFRAMEGYPLYTVAPPTSTGDGLGLAEEVGAGLTSAGDFLPTFGGLPLEGQPGRTSWSERAHLVANERPPWELYVDVRGQRFVAEDEPSIDEKERRLLEAAPELTFHVVFDERALREAPPLIIGATRDEVAAMAGRREGWVSAPTLRELAEAAGIDADGLEATVADYNARLAADAPDVLGRTHRPAPVTEAPFHALRNHGATLITFAGVDVTGELEVRRPDGAPVGGLYAVGEVLGAAPTMGNAFCGGMTLTPALAFGRELGRRLGAALGA